MIRRKSMTKVRATKLITIVADAGEIYEIDFGTAFAADIMNYTDSNICISFNNTFEANGCAKNYLEIGRGCAYNSLKSGNTRIYVKAEESGNIAIVTTY